MKTATAFNRLLFTLIVFSAAAICSAQVCTPASAAAGSLDSCFGTGGVVTTSLSGGYDTARSVVVQPDGKIVVAGIAGESQSTGDFGVVRYNADGSLDPTFDGDGKVTTDFNGGRDFARSVKLQADGKIVVAGTSSQEFANFADYFAVARYNPDGSLDTTFDGDGKVLTNSQAAAFSNSAAMVIQADGKIVVGGGRGDSEFPASIALVVRYNADGSLDNSFDGDGKAYLGGVYKINAVVLQPDGKILAAGRSASQMVVARLNADGSTDGTFGTNGVSTFNDPGRFDEAYSMTLQPDGKILAGGGTGENRNAFPVGVVVRFNANGAFETIFYGGGNRPGISGLYIQPDGKLLTSGFDTNFLPTGFQVIRYGGFGVYDNTFSGDGVLNVGFDGGNTTLSTAYAITMTPDRKIVAAGLLDYLSGGTGKFAVARIMSGLAAPHSVRFDYDGDGKADVSVFRPSTSVWYAFQSSNGQVGSEGFGLEGDAAAPADYDGDGKTDLGVFRPVSGDWWFKSSGSNTVGNIHWGAAGDIPRPSDFDGDGKADFIVYRPSENVWYRFGSGGQTSIVAFGIPGDKPLIGDYDGDGKTDPAIFRSSTGDWWWQSSVDNNTHSAHWGISTDTPVAADFDGDGKTDLAVYRSGTWYVLNSGNGQAAIVNFGLAEDKPVAADYDGDGKADIAVFRPSTGVWYLLQSTSGFAALQFGISTDIALDSEQ